MKESVGSVFIAAIIICLAIAGTSCTKTVYVTPSPTPVLTSTPTSTPAPTSTQIVTPTTEPSPSSKPFMSLNPTVLNFTATERGPSPPKQFISIWNTGGGTLSWSASNGEAWLDQPYPAIGNSTGEKRTVSVSVNTSGMIAGNYSASITISAPGSENSPQIIPVELTIAPYSVKTVMTTWNVTWYRVTGYVRWASQVGTSEFPSTFDYNWVAGAVYDGYTDYVGFDATATINMQRPGGGPVQFIVGGNDGCQLDIDGNKIIDDWSRHSYRKQSVVVSLAPGKHSLLLRYFDYTDVARVSFDCDPDVLKWDEPSSGDT